MPCWILLLPSVLVRQHPEHLSSGHWCPPWPWSQLLWKNKVTLFLWTWLGIKTQRKIMLTENQSSSEVIKGKRCHIFSLWRLQTKYQKGKCTQLKLLKLSRVNLQLQTAFSISWMHWIHCLGDQNSRLYSEHSWRKATLVVNIVNNWAWKETCLFCIKARSCKSSWFYFSNVLLLISNVFGDKLKVSLWSKKDLKKSSSLISRR